MTRSAAKDLGRGVTGAKPNDGGNQSNSPASCATETPPAACASA